MVHVVRRESDPVWVDEEGIISVMMLAAYFGFLNEFSRGPLNHRLPPEIVVHKSDYGPSCPIDCRILKEAECSTPGCERCTMRRGGFAFKWAAQEWLKGYVKLMTEEHGRAPGAWHDRMLERTEGRSQRPCEHNCMYCHSVAPCCYLGDEHTSHKCIACCKERRMARDKDRWQLVLAGGGLPGLKCTNEQKAFMRRLALASCGGPIPRGAWF